jgi:branched-chain amino acid transport system substrate-binding protein
MFGDQAVPDIATRAAWDGRRLIQFRERKKLRKSPVEIDPVERDIIQNVYIREVEKRDDRPVNVDIDEVRMVKDPWKID